MGELCTGLAQHDVTEYSVLNGQLYDLHYKCSAHLCRPSFALSLIDCPWRNNGCVCHVCLFLESVQKMLCIMSVVEWHTHTPVWRRLIHVLCSHSSVTVTTAYVVWTVYATFGWSVCVHAFEQRSWGHRKRCRAACIRRADIGRRSISTNLLLTAGSIVVHSIDKCLSTIKQRT